MQIRDRHILEEAEGFLELGLPKQSLEALARASSGARASFEWSNAAATARIALGDHVDALVHLQEAQHLKPSAIPVYLSLGWCYKRTGQLPRAIAALQTAEKLCRIQRDSDTHAVAMYNLSCYYALAGRREDMLRWLQKAVKADKKYVDMARAETDFERFQADPELKAILTPTG